MKSKEQILDDCAKINMKEWNLEHFSLSHISLHKTIIEAMETYASQFTPTKSDGVSEISYDEIYKAYVEYCEITGHEEDEEVNVFIGVIKKVLSNLKLSQQPKSEAVDSDACEFAYWLDKNGAKQFGENNIMIYGHFYYRGEVKDVKELYYIFTQSKKQ